MLRVSINGGPPVPAANVIVYDDSMPVAIAVEQAEGVLWVDAARDPEFPGLAKALDLTPAATQRYEVQFRKGNQQCLQSDNSL